jgi:hypothetical protein
VAVARAAAALDKKNIPDREEREAVSEPMYEDFFLGFQHARRCDVDKSRERHIVCDLC